MRLARSKDSEHLGLGIPTMTRQAARYKGTPRTHSLRAAMISQIIVWSFLAMAQPLHAGGTPLTTERIAFGLSQPLYLTYVPGDYDRLFVVEKAGRIKIIENGVVLPTPFLNISSIVNSSTLEFGLLGLAFHPQYAQNGYFFVNYIALNGDSVIARFRVSSNPNIADAASRETVLYLAQPNSNHRGGWLDFGFDGYMYCTFGDGGGQNDPNNRAQNINLLQGKLLRLDVDGPDNIMGNADDDAFPADSNKLYAIPPNNPFVGIAGEDEIFAYGLRNPWRASFDRQTGHLYIADVGQNAWEEIDFIPSGSPGGQNFGWRCMEGNHCTGMTGCTCSMNCPSGSGLTCPIYEYGHALGVSITGGYVYRGCAIPDLKGYYFFADYQSSRIWSFRYNGVSVSAFEERTAELDPPGALQINTIASFGEDAYGELYLVDLGGEIFKIIPATFVGPDCNANARRDACDLLSGISADVNGDEVPDECQCPWCRGDVNHDNRTDSRDVARFVTCYLGGSASANGCHCCDMNLDAALTDADVLAFVDKLLGIGDPNPLCP